MSIKLPLNLLLIATIAVAPAISTAAMADTEIAEINATNAAGVTLDYDNGDLWQRIKINYGLTNIQSPLTAKHESWYMRHPDYVQRMIARGGRYLHYIVEEVESRSMPSEIALLPMIESGFNPQALSKSRAAGIWQFMPVTGKHFGLQQNWWADHRKGVTAATTAALDYLQKLHAMFGSWDLALAAYNAGEGTVSRAMEKNQARGLPIDYQSLPLPEETRNYVPKLQAIKNIINNPAHYNLRIGSIPNQPYFTRVMAPEQIDAQLAIRLAEISAEEFAALNPEYNRPVLTARENHSHEILLPVAAAETFAENLANYDQPLVSWQAYNASRGENLANIARRFGITLQDLRTVNDLPNSKVLARDRSLLVPGNYTDETRAQEVAQQTLPLQQAAQHQAPSSVNQAISHTVRANETLFSIALRYGVTIRQIMTDNRLKSSRLMIGQILRIYSQGKSSRRQAIDYGPYNTLANGQVEQS